MATKTQTLLAPLVLMVLVQGSLAAVGIGPAETHPDFPGQCWESELEKAFPVGSSWSWGSCGRATCEGSFVGYATCGSVAVSPPCRLTQDLSLPYPECCPQPVCSEEEPQNSNELPGQRDSDRSLPVSGPLAWGLSGRQERAQEEEDVDLQDIAATTEQESASARRWNDAHFLTAFYPFAAVASQH